MDKSVQAGRRGMQAKYRLGGWLLAAVVLLAAGCAGPPKTFDPLVRGPQMIVEPETIRLGVARVMDTSFTFRGKGFQPGDSVFIEMMGVPVGGKSVNIPIFDAEVDESGRFRAGTRPGYDPQGLTFKIGVLLRAKTGTNDKGETVLIVHQPPIPEGSYTVRAVSMESDKQASATLLIKAPSILDRIKDACGRLLGKIRK